MGYVLADFTCALSPAGWGRRVAEAVSAHKADCVVAEQNFGGAMVESVLAMSFSAHFAAGLGGFSYVDLDTPMFIAEHPFAGGFAQEGAVLDVGHVQCGHGVSWRRSR